MSEEHRMHVEETYENGVQRWKCDTCGREFVLQWPPNYKRIMLHQGDEEAIHTGGAGGLDIGAELTHGSEGNAGFDDIPGKPIEPIDPFLGPWRQWLDKEHGGEVPL